VNFGLAPDNVFNIAGQHLYVGNMWVFKQQTKNIRIRKMSPDTELGLIEDKIFSIFLKVYFCFKFLVNLVQECSMEEG